MFNNINVIGLTEVSSLKKEDHIENNHPCV